MPMTKKYSLCFVDDDENELNRFKVAFEEEFYVGIGTDLGKAETNLRSVLPRRWFSFWGRKVPTGIWLIGLFCYFMGIR
jgi:hypothetical protein